MRAELPGAAGHAPMSGPAVSAPIVSAAAPPLRVCAATGADTGRILDLVRVSLGEGVIPRDPEYWSWKHFRNPFGESPMLLAESGDRVVGLRAFLRWRWETESDTYRAVRAVDTATHPDFRGRGIFTRLTLDLVERMRREGVGFVFNTPNRQSQAGYLKMGWRAVGRTDLWIRPLQPLHLLGALARQWAAGSLQAGGRAAHSPGAEIAGLEAVPALEAFLSRVRARDRTAGLSTPRDAAFLRWRYAEVPGFRYGAVHDVDGSGEGAAIVFRLRPQGPLKELRICELLTTGTRRSAAVAAGLLARLPGRADADYHAVLAPRSAAGRLLLLRSGFLPAPRLGPMLTVRALDGGMAPDPLRRSSWAASIGDLELF
jgi:GNAT superfamily N-acetyltransferase